VTKANASIAAASGSGPNVATYEPGDGKDYQVIMTAGDDGNLDGTLPSYVMSIASSAGAAGRIHFDLFNASGSGKTVVLRLLTVSPVLNTTVTGTLSPDFDLIRTSAVGTAGTTISEASTAPSVSRMDSTDPALPAQITMRSIPTGGATSAVFWQRNYVTQEETSVGAQLAQFQNFLVTEGLSCKRYTLHEGEGVKLVQNTLGVAQNFTITLIFTAV